MFGNFCLSALVLVKPEAIENNKKRKEKNEQFKKLTKEQQNKIKEENKRKNLDFLYIDELNDNELNEIRKITAHPIRQVHSGSKYPSIKDITLLKNTLIDLNSFQV